MIKTVRINVIGLMVVTSLVGTALASNVTRAISQETPTSEPAALPAECTSDVLTRLAALEAELKAAVEAGQEPDAAKAEEYKKLYNTCFPELAPTTSSP